MLRMNKTGILADPADAGPLGEIPFEDGTRIGIPAVRYRPPNLRLDEPDQFLHPCRQDVVIVAAPGIGGDRTPISYPLFSGRMIVRRRQNKDGLAFRQDGAWVGAAGPRTFAGQVIHRAVMSLRDPVFECGIMGRRFRSRHASQDESQLVRFRLDFSL